MARINNITRKEVSNAYIAIVLGLDLKIPLIDPIRCLVKLANKTQVDEKIKRYAIGYLKQVTDSNLSAGKDPMSIRQQRFSTLPACTMVMRVELKDTSLKQPAYQMLQ